MLVTAANNPKIIAAGIIIAGLKSKSSASLRSIGTSSINADIILPAKEVINMLKKESLTGKRNAPTMIKPAEIHISVIVTPDTMGEPARRPVPTKSRNNPRRLDEMQGIFDMKRAVWLSFK